MPTATTLPLIALMILVWKLTKGELISIVLFFSIFQAASAINIGSFGVAPWIFVLVAGMLVKFIRGYHEPHFPKGINPLAVILLAIFGFYAAITGLLSPFLFHGVMAWGSHDRGPSPLTWSSANLNQLCYLAATAVLFVMTLTGGRQTATRSLQWYVRGCFFASLLTFYQLAHHWFHVPFPSNVLYSGSYANFSAYMIDDMWRLNSTFSEASAAAGHLSVGIALCGWDVLTGPFRWKSVLSLATILTAILLTLSSTGYISLLAILAVGGFLYLRFLLTTQRLSRRKALLLVVAAMGFVVVMLTTRLPLTITKAINTVLVEKVNTSSYLTRKATNDAALETARETGYMGAGYGSVRCSGLIQGLLGTVGVPGFALFLSFLFSLAIPLRGYARMRDPGYIYARSLFSLFIVLTGMAVAGNELVAPILWVLFAASALGTTPYGKSAFSRAFPSRSLAADSRWPQGTPVHTWRSSVAFDPIADEAK